MASRKDAKIIFMLAAISVLDTEVHLKVGGWLQFPSGKSENVRQR
jgi:hypothetical protein